MEQTREPTINLYHGDCMEAMKSMRDKQYDLAIVDPPYGINAAKKIGGIGGISKNGNEKWRNQKLNNYAAKGWDQEKPTQEYIEQLARVSRNQIIWGFNHFLSLLDDTPSVIVWDKKASANFSDCELAWSSIGGSVRKFEWLWNGFQKQRPEERFHPTQKPVKLYKWLLKNYAKERDKILDTHGGSMGIAIACYDMGFDLDLWEIDEDYYKAGVKRFNDHKKQLKLFRA